MNKLFLKAIFLCSAFAATQLASAENIEVTPIQQVTQQELAAIYVLSEICPSLLPNQAGFDAGYRNLAQEYLPQAKNAVLTLKKMSTEASFQPILLEAQQDARRAGDAQNKKICQELSAYSN